MSRHEVLNPFLFSTILRSSERNCKVQPASKLNSGIYIRLPNSEQNSAFCSIPFVQCDELFVANVKNQKNKNKTAVSQPVAAISRLRILSLSWFRAKRRKQPKKKNTSINSLFLFHFDETSNRSRKKNLRTILGDTWKHETGSAAQFVHYFDLAQTGCTCRGCLAPAGHKQWPPNLKLPFRRPSVSPCRKGHELV